MQYAAAQKLNSQEINDKLSASPTEEETINLILSAVYFCDTPFAGDCLLKTLYKATGSLSLSLMRVTNTYLQMHRTSYNAQLFLVRMKALLSSSSDNKLEILDLIDGVLAFEEKYKLLNRN